MPLKTTELTTAIFAAMLCKGCGEMAVLNSLIVNDRQRKANVRRLFLVQKITLFLNSKTGHITCYKTGHFYLSLTLNK